MQIESIDAYTLPERVDPANLAGRTVAIIDVLRASTTIVHALAAEAEGVIPFASIDQVERFYEQQPNRADYVRGGERGCVRIEGFDLGNSPAEYIPESVAGKTVLLTTTNGTRAMQQCRQAERVFVTAFVNLSATVTYLRSAARISIVCAGTEGLVSGDDVLLAGALLERLTDVAPSNSSDLPPEAASPATKPLLNPTARAALASWREHLLSGQPLSDALWSSMGAHNLIRLGYHSDIELAARVDRFDIAACLDLHHWHIKRCDATSKEFA